MAKARKETTTKTAAKKKIAPATKEKKKAPAKKAAVKKAAVKKPRLRTLLDGPELRKAVEKMAREITKEFPTPKGLAIMGIRTGGELLAERLKVLLEKNYKAPVGIGLLDITFYRDDLSRLGPDPTVKGSEFPFDIHDAAVILVDDVLFTGRTVRAAMDELTDFGRPALIRLAVLVDRGLRECPISPDYCALRIGSKPEDTIHVFLEEKDDEDRVAISKKA